MRIAGFCKEHSETQAPKTFIRFTKWTPNTLTVILIIIPWTFLHYFLKWEGEYMNKRQNWTILLSIPWKYLFKVPKPRYPSDANSRDKESLNSSTQAKPSQRSGLRSSLRSSTGKVQECSLTQWLHNHTSCTCAALQQQRSSGSSSTREAEEHLSGMQLAYIA